MQEELEKIEKELELGLMPKKARRKTGCWEWPYCLNKTGYGSVTRNYKARGAHRYVYEMIKGKIPEGLQLDHLCRNKSCVNPEHLEIVTNLVNTRRKPNTKLTLEKAEEIRRLYSKGGTSQPKLGRQFGVSKSAIFYILKGILWRS